MTFRDHQKQIFLKFRLVKTTVVLYHTLPEHELVFYLTVYFFMFQSYVSLRINILE